MNPSASSNTPSPRSHTRRVLHDLPVAVLYEWLSTALTPTAWGLADHDFPLALSTALIHRASLEGPQITRPRTADCLFLALVRHGTDGEHAALTRASHAAQHTAARRDWAVALAPALSLQTTALNRAVSCVADATTPPSVPQCLPHTIPDGQARRLLIFNALLGLLLDPAPHAPLPWRAALTGSPLTPMARTLSALFLTAGAGGRALEAVFGCDAAGSPLPSLLLRAPAVQQARVRVRVLIERLRQPRAVELRQGTAQCRETARPWRDWLDWAEDEALTALAAQAGAFRVETAPTDPSDGTQPRWLRGAVHHLLATVLEGEALTTLTHVLMDYLCTVGLSDNVDASTTTSARHLHARLEALARRPEAVLMTSSTSTVLHRTAALASATVRDDVTLSASAATTSLLGPLRASHLTSAAVHLVPCTMPSGVTDAGAHTPLFYWSSSDLLQPRVPQSPSSTTISSPPPPPLPLSRQCRHVLLVRVDPEGDWLPSAESMRNAQTFYTHYANDDALVRQQQSRTVTFDHREISKHNRRDDTDSDDADAGESRFAVLEARQAGLRQIGDTHVASRHHSDKDDEAQSYHTPLERQTEELIHVAWAHLAEDSAVTATTMCTTRPSLPHLVEVTLRLYLYALLLSQSTCATSAEAQGDEGLFVIVTPERLPPFVKQFGLRHAAWLRALVEAHVPTCPPRRSAASARLSTAPIHVVDDALLEYYTLLQTRVRRSHSTVSGGGATSSSAVILCRDRLRPPRHPVDALLRVQHVSVTTPAQLFDMDGQRAAPAQASRLRTYTHNPHAFFAGAPAGLSGRAEVPAAPATVPPPFHRQQQTQRLLVLYLDDAQCGGAAHHATLDDGAGTRLVLVAPTPGLASFYESTLRRTADTLLSLYTSADLDTSPSPSPLTLVRGGGAYFVAVAAQLRHISHALDADSDEGGSLDVRAGDDRVGLSLARRSPHRRCLTWLLRLLATALLAIPLSLWEQKQHDMAYATSVGATGPHSPDSLAVNPTRGVTGARRRAQWGLDVTAAMEASLTRAPGPTVASVTVVRTSLEAHITQLLSSSVRDGGGLCGSDGSDGVHDDLPLLEPIAPNRGAIRGALELLLSTLTVASP